MITDFGTSTLCDGYGAKSQGTVGTPPFFSPELCITEVRNRPMLPHRGLCRLVDPIDHCPPMPGLRTVPLMDWRLMHCVWHRYATVSTMIHAWSTSGRVALPSISGAAGGYPLRAMQRLCS